MELLFLIVVIAIGAALVRGYYRGGLTGNHRQLALTAEQDAQYAAWIKAVKPGEGGRSPIDRNSLGQTIARTRARQGSNRA
jgi:hypothetical protein